MLRIGLQFFAHKKGVGSTTAYLYVFGDAYQIREVKRNI